MIQFPTNNVEPTQEKSPKPPVVLIDGVAFQDAWNHGICRVLESVLKVWTETGFAQQVSVLDRGETLPDIPGINRVPFPRREDCAPARDTFLLQKACDEASADVFVSTNYTSPITTPSVCMVYDFIPERLGGSMKDIFWQEKAFAIHHASAFVCISRSTADDLHAIHPGVRQRPALHAHLGIGGVFRPRAAGEVQRFREKHAVGRPYFLLVGERIGLVNEEKRGRGYKNAALFFRALEAAGLAATCDVVLVGGAKTFEAELAALAPSVKPVMLSLSDDDLACAYSGALCLAYPSKYEGFGLPVAEALCCGCPVVTCRNSSLVEIAGEDAVYVDPDDHVMLTTLLRQAAEGGFGRLSDSVVSEARRRFRWSGIADLLQSTLLSVAAEGSSGSILWQELRRLQLVEEEPKLPELKKLVKLLPGMQRLARLTLPARRRLVAKH